ncbi:hypothetical protein LTS10_007250 [Elasticomyces elasticus]|nr:hypothetical protein LTS10_007250 [Elasticomyces elasticus]
MPPPTPPETTTTASSTASDPTCITCGNNTGLERIDGTKLNRLAETLIKHLSSDVHGNWTVKGSRTTVGKDPRLGQLVEVTSLRTELGEFRAVFERYIALHAPKELVETDKPLTMNKNMRVMHDSTNPHMVVAQNGNGYYVNTTKHFLNGGRLMGDYIWSTRGSLAWLEHADAVRRPDSEVYLWSCYNNLGVKLYDEVTRKWTAEQNLVPDLRLS